MTTVEQPTFTIGRLYRPAFYAAVVGALGLFVVMMRNLLPLAATAWVIDTGPHRFHDLNFFALIWIAILGIAVQLYHAEERVTAAIVPLLVMAPLALLAASTNSPIAMMPILFSVVALVVILLHPAGRSVLHVRRVQEVDRLSAGLVVAALIPLAVYAVDQLAKQYTVADDHTVLVHYGGMALIALFIPLMGSLGVIRQRDWRFAAWSAAALAVYLGASSIAFPELASSAGPIWGGLGVAWGITFIAAVETARHEGYVRVESSIDIDAPIETVWEVTTDPQSYVEAIDWVFEATREDDGPIGKGSVYVERAKPGLNEGRYRWEITEYQPPTRIVHAHSGSEIDAELKVLLDELDDGPTRYTQIMNFRAFPSFRPLGYLLERTVMKQRMQRDFDQMILPNYKRFAEERAGASDE